MPFQKHKEYLKGCGVYRRKCNVCIYTYIHTKAYILQLTLHSINFQNLPSSMMHYIMSTNIFDHEHSQLSEEICYAIYVYSGKQKTWMVWAKEETAAVRTCFQEHIRRGILPRKTECLKIVEHYPCLKYSPWLKIRYHVKNIIVTNKKAGIFK